MFRKDASVKSQDSELDKVSKRWADCRADRLFESKGFDWTFSTFSAGMSDNLSTGISAGGDTNRLNISLYAHNWPCTKKETQYVIITSDAISLQVNPLQCGYFCQLVGKDGEVVISQIDAGQILHAGHSHRQFGENISLQVQFCNTFQRHGGEGVTSTMCD